MHGGVVWGRVGRVDTEVTLEARDGSVFLCFEEEFVLLGCCGCEVGKKENESEKARIGKWDCGVAMEMDMGTKQVNSGAWYGSTQQHIVEDLD